MDSYAHPDVNRQSLSCKFHPGDRNLPRGDRGLALLSNEYSMRLDDSFGRRDVRGR